MSRLRATLGRLLGREPVITVSTIVAILIAALPATGWSAIQIGSVAGALVLLGGAVEAWLVAVDRALPLLVGVGKAVLAAVATFGVQLPGHWVAAVMGVLTVLGGLEVRKQVVPPQAAQWKRGAEPIAGEIDWVGHLSPGHLPEPDLTGEPIRSQVPPDAPPLPSTDDRPTSAMPMRGSLLDEWGRASYPRPNTEVQRGERERGAEGRHRPSGNFFSGFEYP